MMNRLFGILFSLGMLALIAVFFGVFIVWPSWKTVADKREALEKADRLVEVVVKSWGYELHGRIGAHDAKIERIDIDDPRINDEYARCMNVLYAKHRCVVTEFKQVGGKNVAIVKVVHAQNAAP